jgi:hypothetical protein
MTNEQFTAEERIQAIARATETAQAAIVSNFQLSLTALQHYFNSAQTAYAETCSVDRGEVQKLISKETPVLVQAVLEAAIRSSELVIHELVQGFAPESFDHASLPNGLHAGAPAVAVLAPKGVSDGN